MTIQEIFDKETVTLKIDGRLDTVTAPEFEKKVSALGEEVKHLILDMEGLTYISSAGLRVLLAAQKKMNQLGTMKVIKVSDLVMDVIEMTGFADILEIE